MKSCAGHHGQGPCVLLSMLLTCRCSRLEGRGSKRECPVLLAAGQTSSSLWQGPGSDPELVLLHRLPNSLLTCGPEILLVCAAPAHSHKTHLENHRFLLAKLQETLKHILPEYKHPTSQASPALLPGKKHCPLPCPTLPWTYAHSCGLAESFSVTFYGPSWGS